MNAPDQFISSVSFLTLFGSVSIVYIVGNVFQSVFNFRPKWFILVISELVSILGLIFFSEITFQNVIIAILNGFLICLTALGSNSVINRRKKPKVEEKSYTAKQIETKQIKRSFFSNWDY